MQLTRSMAALAAAALALCSTVVIAHGLSEQPTQAATDIVAANVEALTGIVHELIVDDTTRGTSQRYLELELADGSLVALQGDAAQALSRDANVEVRGHRAGKALDVESSRALPRGAAPNAKALTEVDGTLAILHADNFAEGRGSFVYEVHHAAGHVLQLRIAVTPSMLEPGMHVRVQGRASADGASMTPDRITILSRQASAQDGVVAKAAVANSVLVIMANFSNTAAPAFSASQVQQVMTSNSDSVDNFFRETSYGQQVMNVTTTPGWVTLNLPQPTACGSADWQNISTNAEASAKTLGAAYDAATYNFVVYVFPVVPSCGWTGLAYIGKPHKAWINGTGSFKTATIAHEMGHNFGLLHAASLRCPTAIGGTCSSSEYGDPFDAMGNQRAMHYNAMQKAKLAWIPSTSVKTHTSGSATYTLAPIEVAGAATYAVKIPTSSANRTYWLEFRQPIGFDSPLAAFPNNGVEVRVSYPFETQCPGCTINSADTELLDMTPSTTAFTDATLPVGQTFSDPTYGINVTVLSATASALTVQVGIGTAPAPPPPPPPPPPPAPTATTTTIAATANPSTAGALVTITASVSGNAPTGSMTFVDNGVAIAGCGGSTLSGSGNVRSASCSTSALLTGNHTIVSSYGGDAGNLASTSSYTQVVNSPVNGTNVAPPAPLAPTGVSASDGTSTMSVTVTWNASSNATSYTVYRSTAAGTQGTPIGTPTGGTTLSDTTAVAGTTYYYGVMATGRGGTSALSAQDSGFANAPISVSLVDHYYQSILGRAPDSGGKAFWENEVARMQGLGVDVREVYMVMAGVFFSSPEYASLRASDTRYVTDLYNTFFNRAPDAAGLAYWTQQIAAGVPRNVVLDSFLFSPEFSTFMSGLFGNTTSRAEVYAVVDYYRGFLNRLPDTAGFNYWLGQFHAAQCSGTNAAAAIHATANSISSQFISSAEYAQRNRSNTEFVSDLYYTFLRRGGDLAGVSFWINQLDSGAEDRETMRREFIDSSEFNARISAIIAQGC